MTDLPVETLRALARECQELARFLGDHQNHDFVIKDSDSKFILKGKHITKVVNSLLSAGNIFEVIAEERTKQT